MLYTIFCSLRYMWDDRYCQGSVVAQVFIGPFVFAHRTNPIELFVSQSLVVAFPLTCWLYGKGSWLNI